LYGPNAHNALLNTITKDPRKYQGTTVALTAGSRYQFSARLRQAAAINKKWANKLTGEYATGKDFIFYDSVKAGGPPFGPAVKIPERNPDFDFRHLRGEGHLYYSITPKADIIVSAGGSNNNYIQVTNSARNQIRGLTYSFIQARFVHPRFFVNVYNAWGTLGTSYGIAPYTRDYWNETHRIPKPMSPDSAEIYAMRLGNQFKEENQRINAEAQYNYTFQKIGLALVTGVSYQKDKPNAFGITLVDKDQRIYVTQAGAVLQLEKTLPWDTKLIASGRLDHHSNFGNFFSPKLALVTDAGKGSIRITWGKAYSMPSILFQYTNLFGQVFGNGEGVRYAPNGPNFNDNWANPTITKPLVPEEIGTWEIGYKGTIARKLFIDINYYYGLSHNFLSPSQAVGGRAKSVGDIPVVHNPPSNGVVINDTLKNASFLTYFNYGDVRAYGLDAALNYMFNKHISLGIKYSWFGSDITNDNIKNDANKDGYVSAEEKSLNAPKNRFVTTLGFQNLCRQKLFVNVAARYVQQYDFYSGNQIGTAAGKGTWGVVLRPPLPPLPKNFDRGPLGGFTTFDLSAGYKASELVSLVMGITNLTNIEQQEFVGCPPIGRLISFEVKIHVPNASRK
jgi:iron complex outermembrane receptor protein